MPHPSEVNPSRFQVEKILYNIEGFSIAYGFWEDGNKHLAVRWDGEEGKLGFPQTFGKPQWLLIPDKLSVPITKALLDTDISKQPILEILKELLK